MNINLGWAYQNYQRVKRLHDIARTAEDRDIWRDIMKWYQHKMTCDKRHRPDSIDLRDCQAQWWVGSKK